MKIKVLRSFYHQRKLIEVAKVGEPDVIVEVPDWLAREVIASNKAEKAEESE